MFKEIYRRLNDSIKPEEALIEAAVQKIRREEPKRTVRRRPVLAAAAVCLVLVLAVPVLAATVQPVYELMYLVSPSVAQFFIPVQMSDTNNGIKMEVVSAEIHENMARVYMTLQDLAGDRVDGTTDLYDSYDIRLPFDASARCERLGFDPVSRTATFLITIEGPQGSKIPTDKVTFSVGMFLSDQHIYEDLQIPVDLARVPAAPQTAMQPVFGGSGEDFEKEVDWRGSNQALAMVPGQPDPAFLVEGIGLTGIGYVEGKLHVQTQVKDPLSNDNHGYFYLVDAAGGKILSRYAFAFQEHQGDQRIDYDEFVFDVGPEDAAAYTLYGDFYTSGRKTEGGWKVTFRLTEEE